MLLYFFILQLNDRLKLTDISKRKSMKPSELEKAHNFKVGFASFSYMRNAAQYRLTYGSAVYFNSSLNGHFY